MTPNEKAAQLVVDNQLKVKSLDYKEAVACAIVTVEEIIKVLPQSEYLEDRLEMIENRELIYWREVKQILERL